MDFSKKFSQRPNNEQKEDFSENFLKHQKEIFKRILLRTNSFFKKVYWRNKRRFSENALGKNMIFLGGPMGAYHFLKNI